MKRNLFCVPIAFATVVTQLANCTAVGDEIERKLARSEFDMKEFRNFISHDLSRPMSVGSLALRGITTRTVHGQVLDHEGNPIIGALVAIAEPIGYSHQCYDENFDKTDELGRFLVEGHQSRSRLAIRRGPGQIWRFNLKPDKRNVEIEWPKLATCKVTVNPKLCKPGAAITITTTKYWAGMSIMRYETRLDQNHQATVNNMIPGEYFISSSKTIAVGDEKEEKSWPVDIGQFTIDAGETKDVRCEPVGVRIKGRLEDATKKVAEDGKMFLRIARQKNVYHDWSRSVDVLPLDREGKFQTAALQPGRYVFRFYRVQKEEPRGGLRGFGAVGGDHQWYKTRVTINEGDSDFKLTFPQHGKKGIVGFVHQTLDSEPLAIHSWAHSDVQVAQLKRHEDRLGVSQELLRILADPHTPQPWLHVTVEALGQMLETPGIVDALLKTLEKPHRVRSRASIFRALQTSKDSAGKIIDGIAKYRKSDDLILRNATHSALGRLAATSPEAKEKAVPFLIDALSDSDERLRSDAAASLGRCKAEQSVEKLYELREDRNGKVAVWAAWAIWQTTRAREQAVAVMTTRLRAKTFDGKWDAVYLLSEFDDPTEEIIDALVELTKFDEKPPYHGDNYQRIRLKRTAESTLKKIAPDVLGNASKP